MVSRWSVAYATLNTFKHNGLPLYNALAAQKPSFTCFGCSADKYRLVQRLGEHSGVIVRAYRLVIQIHLLEIKWSRRKINPLAAERRCAIQ